MFHSNTPFRMHQFLIGKHIYHGTYIFNSNLNDKKFKKFENPLLDHITFKLLKESGFNESMYSNNLN